MSLLEWNYRIVGILLVLLGLAHGYFPRHFGWKSELAPLKLLTRQMFLVHNTFIGYTILLQGLLCTGWPIELVKQSRLAGVVLGGLCAFWAMRLWAQFFTYKPDLWRGKGFETGIHVAFGLLWAYLTCTFGYGAWLQLAV